MDSSEIRYVNFMALFKEFRESNADRPDRGMLKLFASKLGISQGVASHIKCGHKSIGSKYARQFEQAMGKQAGWLDLPHKGQHAVNDGEQMFIDTALTFYRINPDEARKTILDGIKKHMNLQAINTSNTQASPIRPPSDSQY